jgi:hypothetical protein
LTASSRRFLVINQRGDSLMKKGIPARNIPPGISWTAKGMSHCLRDEGMC